MSSGPLSNRWLTLVEAHGVTGFRAHDARLVAAMQSYGISQIMTFNGGHFRGLPLTVHNKNLISYYEERSQQLDKVLSIFIRMNSGGTVLSYSDLLLSIAVAQWSGDARTEIHTLVDELNATGEGFNFSKDLVLKAGLMLAEIGNVGFKVENFVRENMEILEKRWPDIKRSLAVTVRLLASFGFNEKTLRADSAVLPIAYYVCRRNLDFDYVTKGQYASDSPKRIGQRANATGRLRARTLIPSQPRPVQHETETIGDVSAEDAPRLVDD